MTERRELWNDKNYHELRKMASRGSKEWFILDDVCVLAAAQGAVCDHTREALELTLAPWLDEPKDERHPALVAWDTVCDDTAGRGRRLEAVLDCKAAVGETSCGVATLLFNLHERMYQTGSAYSTRTLDSIRRDVLEPLLANGKPELKQHQATVAWEQACDVTLSDGARTDAMRKCMMALPSHSAARRLISALNFEAEHGRHPLAEDYYPSIWDKCLRHDWPDTEAATDDG